MACRVIAAIISAASLASSGILIRRLRQAYHELDEQQVDLMDVAKAAAEVSTSYPVSYDEALQGLRNLMETDSHRLRKGVR